METLGWLGGVLLATCSLPELYKAVKTKSCTLTWSFLLMWLFGEIFILIPVLDKALGAFLVFNYSLNIVIISILCVYKYRTVDVKAS